MFVGDGTTIEFPVDARRQNLCCQETRCPSLRLIPDSSRRYRATGTRQRAMPLNRVICHEKETPMPADQLTLQFLAGWPAGFPSATGLQKLTSTHQHSERPTLSSE
jgi:hypothetical protein